MADEGGEAERIINRSARRVENQKIVNFPGRGCGKLPADAA